MTAKLLYLRRAEIQVKKEETTLGQLAADLQEALDYGLPPDTVLDDIDDYGNAVRLHFVEKDEKGDDL